MDSKEKAKELVFKFDDAMEFATPKRFAKKCASIAVDEMLNMANIYDLHNADKPTHIYTFNVVLYWKEVKQEIENL